MNCFFGEILEPATRALFDDCSDEETEDQITCEIVSKTALTCPAVFKTFLVVEGSVALAFAEAYLINQNHKIIGEISLRNTSNSDEDLRKHPIIPLVLQDDLLICFINPSAPPEVAFKFADSVLPVCEAADQVVTLISQPASSYKATKSGERPVTNAVFAFATSQVEETLPRPLLPHSNLVNGLSAAATDWNSATTAAKSGFEEAVEVWRSKSSFRYDVQYVHVKMELEEIKGGGGDEAGQSFKMLNSETGSFRVRRRLDLGEVSRSDIVESPDTDDLKEMPDESITEAPSNAVTVSRSRSDRDKKLGHRRVREDGNITYKKVQTSQIMGSIQLGIQHAVGGLASKPERDLLMQDFMTVETYNFPTMGSSHTPAHHFSEFRFKNYAPIAFRYFRELFGIQPDDFLISMCSAPLRELSNPGASGSIFYVTDDDELIIKTVQHKEGEFLQKLLPGYYMNLNQNPRTLLPKFFGLYCYQVTGKNIRLVVMNNLLPSHVKMHQKYDLKGSTYKRKASKTEREKASPTYKDLDFVEHHPEGLYLEPETYCALMKTIQRDCRVLESFKIMDYSLLVGIHNQDDDEERRFEGELNRSRSIRQRLMTHATPMESIHAHGELENDLPSGGIPAKNSKGDRLILYIGIIDILQSYKFKKMLEHTWKALIHDGDTVSVHRPDFYAQRFQDFMAKSVFRKFPSPARSSVWKRRSLGRVSRQETPRVTGETTAVSVESNSFTSGIESMPALTASNSGTTSGSSYLQDANPGTGFGGDAMSSCILRHVTTIHVEN